METTLAPRAEGLPEPAFIINSLIQNVGGSNARLAYATLTWTIMPTTDAPVTITTSISNPGEQYSYFCRLPLESVVCNATRSANVLQLNSTSTTYIRTNVTLTIGANIFPEACVQNSAALLDIHAVCIRLALRGGCPTHHSPRHRGAFPIWRFR